MRKANAREPTQKWQQMTTNDNKWQRMTENDNEWQQMTKNDRKWQGMSGLWAWEIYQKDIHFTLSAVSHWTVEIGERRDYVQLYDT